MFFCLWEQTCWQFEQHYAYACLLKEWQTTSSRQVAFADGRNMGQPTSVNRLCHSASFAIYKFKLSRRVHTYLIFRRSFLLQVVSSERWHLKTELQCETRNECIQQREVWPLTLRCLVSSEGWPLKKRLSINWRTRTEPWASVSLYHDYFFHTIQ